MKKLTSDHMAKLVIAFFVLMVISMVVAGVNGATSGLVFNISLVAFILSIAGSLGCMTAADIMDMD